ncbi:hypothetical protein [Psychroserpens sp.]|uniref:hypothetical protein n=1 Tax=Psychroserpens sp. TaxID=2020870 RepID=UPI0039E46496
MATVIKIKNMEAVTIRTMVSCIVLTKDIFELYVFSIVPDLKRFGTQMYKINYNQNALSEKKHT